MPKPDYQRPFEDEDFRGYFTWNDALTAKLGGRLYHACHHEEFETILAENQLGLRSEWSLVHPTFGEWEAPCSWCGLNDYVLGNYYGPIRIAFPLTVLTGRTFMVFRRVGADRKRFFFVQYEANIPLFSRDDNPWRRVAPYHYFDGEAGDDDVSLQNRAIYDVVITSPLPLVGATFSAVSHPKCVPVKCETATREETRKWLKALAVARIEDHLQLDSGVQAMLTRFPDLVGAKITLLEP